MISRHRPLPLSKDRFLQPKKQESSWLYCRLTIVLEAQHWLGCITMLTWIYDSSFLFRAGLSKRSTVSLFSIDT